MKKNIFSFILFIFLFCFESEISFSQIHTWPPDPVPSSQLFKNFKFTSGKYLPSTKRWNLVWADQIIPNNLASGKMIEFAAGNYIGTQKIWPNQLNEFEKYNQNFLCLIYHLSVGLNPENNSDCPDPKNSSSGNIGSVTPKGFSNEYKDYYKPWLVKNNIEEGSSAFESMFQHYDSSLAANRVWHVDPQWVMNAADNNWRKYITETTKDWMDGNRNEGCFFDVAYELNVPGMQCPYKGAPNPYNFNWWENPRKPLNSNLMINNRSEFAVFQNDLFREYYKYIYKQFHYGGKDYLIIPNVDQMITTVYDPLWLNGDIDGEAVDGAMMENFGTARGADMLLSLGRCISHITGRGKILIAQAYIKQQSEALRIAAEYMLVKNESSYINIMKGSSLQWYPEYEIDLGNQSKIPTDIEKMKISGKESLLKRGYDNGEVVCNISDQPIDYNPYGEKWFYVKTTGGGPVDSNGNITQQKIELVKFSGKISIPASDCMIFVKDTITSVDNENIDKNISIYPNPAYDYAEVEIKQAKNIKNIELYNSLGNRIQAEIEYNIYGNNLSAKIKLGLLDKGVYFIRISDSNSLFCYKLIKIE